MQFFWQAVQDVVIYPQGIVRKKAIKPQNMEKEKIICQIYRVIHGFIHIIHRSWGMSGTMDTGCFDIIRKKQKTHICSLSTGVDYFVDNERLSAVLSEEGK